MNEEDLRISGLLIHCFKVLLLSRTISDALIQEWKVLRPRRSERLQIALGKDNLFLYGRLQTWSLLEPPFHGF